MAAFGFSVGDFFTGVNLLIEGISSLSDTNGAQADYEGLARQLQNLRCSLDCIEALDLDTLPSKQAEMVVRILSDCRLSVDDFVKRNSKFKSLENASGSVLSLATIKRQGRKVQWALWKKADVAKFRTVIQQHGETMQMLLATVQIKKLDSQSELQGRAEVQNVEHRQLTQKVYRKLSNINLRQRQMETRLVEERSSIAQILTAQYEGIRHERHIDEHDQNSAYARQRATSMHMLEEFQGVVSQIKALQDLEKPKHEDAFDLKEQLFAVTENQQRMLAKLRAIDLAVKVNQEVPPQVLLSKPVVLLDACGRYMPFHLETVDSVEALTAILKVRFKNAGLRNLEQGQFVLVDSNSNRNLRTTEPWTAIVRPGQHIKMSIVFVKIYWKETSLCPNCGTYTLEKFDVDIACENLAFASKHHSFSHTHLRAGDPTNLLMENPSTGDDVETCDQDDEVDEAERPRGSIEEESPQDNRIQIVRSGGKGCLPFGHVISNKRNLQYPDLVFEMGRRCGIRAQDAS